MAPNCLKAIIHEIIAMTYITTLLFKSPKFKRNTSEWKFSQVQNLKETH